MSELQEWREQTQNLTLRVREAIADAAIEGNLAMVQTLTEALSPLQGMLDTLIDSRRCWQRQMDAIQSHLSSATTRGAVTRLQIIINWRATGRSLEPLTLQESTAAKTLAKFMDALARVLGTDILPKLKVVPVGNAGLVSRQPELDFVNPVTGDIYGHQPIGATGWFVHTHTANSTKLEQIDKVCALLSLPFGTVTAKMIPNPTN
jgi:hypothetical protein